MALMSTEVRRVQTNTAVFIVKRAGGLSSTSSKSLVSLIRPSTGQIMGTIRFRSLEGAIELTINGRTTKLKDDGIFNFRYSFVPTSNPNAKWWWTEENCELTLMDGKSGRLIATVSGNLLICEQSAGLTEAAVDDVIVSAIAAFTKRGKNKEDDEIVEGVLSGVLGI